MSYQNQGQLPVADQGPALDPRYLEKKKARRKKERAPGGGPLSITSLMDALTIVLCFLLSTYASEPISIQQNEKLRVAFSLTKQQLEGAAKVEIQTDAIYCNDQQSALLRTENGVRTVDEKAKSGGKSAFLITDLKAQLESYREQLTEIEKRGGRKYETKNWLLLVADVGTPARIVKEVLYTAREAGYERYMFAVIRTVVK